METGVTVRQRLLALLGVPPGRLYHHVDRLSAAGLIKTVAERQRRGAVERTLQATGGGQVTSIRLRLTPERLALLKGKLADLLGVLETADGIETDILLVAEPVRSDAIGDDHGAP